MKGKVCQRFLVLRYTVKEETGRQNIFTYYIELIYNLFNVWERNSSVQYREHIEIQ